MELILGALIISIGIIASAWLSAKSKAQYHIKPKLSFAQVTIVGRTEESETMQLTTSLFEDETEEVWMGKINKLLTMREDRLGLQNNRMMAIQEEQKKLIEAEKAKMEAEEQSKKPTLVK